MHHTRIIMLIFVFLMSSVPACFADTPEYKLAIREKGKVDYQKQRTEAWTSIIASVLLRDGDLLKTHELAGAALRLYDGSTVKIGENTLVEVSQYGGTRPNWIQVLAGKVLVHVQRVLGRKQSFEVRTPTATLAARGTVFSVDVVNVQGSTVVQAIHGSVEVQAHGVKTVLSPGKTALINPQGSPIIVPRGFQIILVAVPAPSGDKGGTQSVPEVSPSRPVGTGNQTVYETPWKPADYAPMVSQDAPQVTAAPAVSAVSSAPSTTGAILSTADSTSSTSSGSTTSTTTSTTTATTTTTSTPTTTLPPPVTPPFSPTGGIQVIIR
ncbi:MAG: FecR domain-containing protein [Armatimonadetes bacterium]|nr:FecR domain-containing protein [Armatimonadota bacterium]